MGCAIFVPQRRKLTQPAAAGKFGGGIGTAFNKIGSSRVGLIETDETP
jgi:hypothetical protein